MEPRGSVPVGRNQCCTRPKHPRRQPTTGLAMEQTVRPFSDAVATVATTQSWPLPRFEQRNSGRCDSNPCKGCGQPSRLGSPAVERRAEQRWNGPNGPPAAHGDHATEPKSTRSKPTTLSDIADAPPCGRSFVASVAACCNRCANSSRSSREPSGNSQTARPHPSPKRQRLRRIASQRGCRSESYRSSLGRLESRARSRRYPRAGCRPSERTSRGSHGPVHIAPAASSRTPDRIAPQSACSRAPEPDCHDAAERLVGPTPDHSRPSGAIGPSRPC